MRTERAEALIRQALTEGRVQPFIRSKVRKHIEAPMTQMLLGEPQVKQMAAQLARHGFTHESSMAFNSKVAHHKFKRGHRLITVTRFKEPEGNRVIWSSAGLTGHGQDGRGEHYTTLTTHLRAITPRRVHEENSRFRVEPMKRGWAPPDFEDFRNRAWISPEGNVHPLRQGTEKEPWRGQTHGDWAVNNRSVHGHQGDLWDVFDKMQGNGWVRKTAKDFYDIGPHNEDSIATVHKHFTTHHPELDSVRVVSHSGLYKLHKRLRDPAAEKAQTDALARQLTQESEHSWKDEFGEKSDFADLHQRAWITPWGKVHPLGRDGQETHGGWITRVRNSQNPYTEYDDMTNAGWVRKVNSRRYTGAKHTIPTALAHVRKHHPEVGRILFTVANGAAPYREYVIDTKTGAGTKRGLKRPMTPVHEVYK
jgi:hypothetical protein